MYSNRFKNLLMLILVIALLVAIGVELKPAAVMAGPSQSNKAPLFWQLFLPLVSREQGPSQKLLMRCQLGLFESADGGDTWQQLSSLNGQLIALDYSNPGRILWARDDGLWASTNHGETWTYLGVITTTAGVTVTQLTTSAALPNMIFASLSGSTLPMYSLDGGASWHTFETMPPWNQSTVWDKQSYGAIVPKVAGSQDPRWLVGVNDLFRSGDYGATWTSDGTPGGYIDQHFPVLVTSPVDASRLYTVLQYEVRIPQGDWAEEKVYTSTDNGLQWTEITPLSGYDNYQKIIPSPIIAKRVYLTVFGAYPWYQSDDGGLTWVGRNFPVSTLAPDARNASWLYGYSVNTGGVRSTDGGDNWQTWSTQPCESGYYQKLELLALP